MKTIFAIMPIIGMLWAIGAYEREIISYTGVLGIFAICMLFAYFYYRRFGK